MASEQKNEYLLWSDSRNLAIYASAEGISIKAIDLFGFLPSDPLDWERVKSPLRIRNFGRDLPYFLNTGLVEKRGDDLFISTPNIYAAISEEVGLLVRVIRFSPLSLSIRSTGTLGLPDFAFGHSWYLGVQPAFPELQGAFLRFRNKAYLLDKAQFDALQTVALVNGTAPPGRSKQLVLKAIAALQRQSELGDVHLEDILPSNTIVEPEKVGVGIQRETGAALSLYPVFENVEPEAMREAFMQQSSVDAVYDLPRQEGGRVRVILSDDIREVLHDLRKARHISGDKARRIERTPGIVLRDGINRNVLDDSFSPRVIGLTDVSVSQWSKHGSRSRGWLEDDESEVNRQPHCSGDDLAEEAEIGAPMPNESRENSLLKEFQPTYRRLEIYTNQESVDFSEGAVTQGGINDKLPHPRLPASLVATRTDLQGIQRPFSLKKHQREGVSWLQQLYTFRESHRGCLLADDMGLGKTLQLLSFLASVVEGEVGAIWPNGGPYEPILVVAPRILFNTWLHEIERSFSPSPFGDVLTLHDRELRRFRLPDTGTGNELKLEESVLDIARVRDHRLVVTNYDTVRNFQHSFAQVQWSIVVADEAQEIKSLSITSDAMKALKAFFKVASTGTPVENRLLDLWNIVDFLQPGTLLGSARNFVSEYEDPMCADDSTRRAATSQRLRDVLGYNKPLGTILRREKGSALPDLPIKEVRKIECDLTEEQIYLYTELREKARLVTERGRQLTMISRDLKDLFYHPRLYKRQLDETDPRVLLAESPKLQSLIDVLKEVRRAEQKALVFCERRAMQMMIAAVVEHVFGFRPFVINSYEGTGSRESENSRSALIREFELREGFNAIVLSPMCAGVGLTITGANHVIHYGRWWNPAVEKQATDRAYRIGQNLPVFVYHLISRDRSGRLSRSFDQILDELLLGKEAVASDFLVGGAQCELTTGDVLSAVLSEPRAGAAAGVVKVGPRDVENLDPHVFEELCGILLERQGFFTLMSPRSHDHGVDLIAWNELEIRLVQCKHTSDAHGAVPSDAIEELMGGEQSYQRELQRVRGSRRTVLSVMTNGKLSGRDRRRAQTDDVVVFGRADIHEMLKLEPLTHADLSEYRSRRCLSRKDLVQRLGQLGLKP